MDVLDEGIINCLFDICYLLSEPTYKKIKKG